MDLITGGLALPVFAAALAVAVFAGMVKGMVGFAMPMIMISALGSFLTAEMALAYLIVPTLVANLQQALRQGLGPALGVWKDYWRFILTVVVFLAFSAQLVTRIPQSFIFGVLGVPIFLFAVVQLAGQPLKFEIRHKRRWEVGLGSVGGFLGGLSGVWGPPLVAYLLSTGVEKRESVRVQGVVYMIGSVSLFLAHLNSGVLNARTLPPSVLMVVPATLGMWLGFVLQDRLDQGAFRRWTLVVLAVAGLNLLRRALTVDG